MQYYSDLSHDSTLDSFVVMVLSWNGQTAQLFTIHMADVNAGMEHHHWYVSQFYQFELESWNFNFFLNVLYFKDKSGYPLVKLSSFLLKYSAIYTQNILFDDYHFFMKGSFWQKK